MQNLYYILIIVVFILYVKINNKSTKLLEFLLYITRLDKCFFLYLSREVAIHMKKIYKRLLSLVLSVLMIFSAITFLSVNAEVYVIAAETVPANAIGDADGNGDPE